MLPRHRMLWVLVPLLALSWLVLAVVGPDGPRNGLEYPVIGFLLGTMFGQATLASAWTAFGPLPLVWRLPLSLAWVAVLLVCMTISVSGSPGPGDILPVFALCLGGQWLLVQLPLWGLALGYGLALRYMDDRREPQARLQFGIRQLMILTAIVAVVLGTGRVLLLSLADDLGNSVGHEAPIFIFLAAAAIVMTLPLLMAALLPRWAGLAVAAVLAFIAVATTWEMPLLSLLPGGGGPNYWHLIWINGFTAAWVLAVVAILRWGKYGLAAAA